MWLAFGVFLIYVPALVTALIVGRMLDDDARFE